MFSEDTGLRYRYETRYRTATIMEEDALNQPTAAGEMSSAVHMQLVVPHMSNFVISVGPQGVISLCLSCSSFLEADLSLHTLSESPCGSLVVYVIPESSSLLPKVQIQCFDFYSSVYVTWKSVVRLLFPV